jgi:fused signal recognition particle receptor
MFIGYLKQGEDIVNEIQFVEDGPTVLLVVGVNGVGKTTSIAKLAYRYKKAGKKVLLVAGDTFRAGAVAQLEVWAKRLDVPIVLGKDQQDPASVAYDGVIKGKELGIDLIIDATTGQNGILQAKAFAEATGLTGVVITKMDGTSKGGIILAIRDEIGVPVRFIGLGEKLEDLDEFDLEKYLYGLCLGAEE